MKRNHLQNPELAYSFSVAPLVRTVSHSASVCNGKQAFCSGRPVSIRHWWPRQRTMGSVSVIPGLCA